MQRLPFVDWARGFAVMAMVLWHTGDAWLVPGLKDGQGFFLLRFVGGLAAPSFLLLAGAGAALASERGRTPDQVLWAGLGRGLEIVVFGYALRLQSWLIDAQALLSLRFARATVPLTVGYFLLYRGAHALGSGSTARITLRALAGPALVLVGLLQVPGLAPQRLTRLLQVDVLQCIGAALCLLALLERYARVVSKPWRALALGVVVACCSEPLASVLPGVLPVPIASYLARLPVRDGVLPALFPLFPWFSYACVGAALGRSLRSAEQPGKVVLWAAMLGALIGLCTSEALPFVHRTVRDFPWTIAPVRTGFRTAIVLTLLMAGFAWVSAGHGAIMQRLGRHSLRVYWAHMLFAYGLFGRPVQHELHYPSWLGLVLLLLAAMWLLTRVGRQPGPVPSGHKIRLEPRSQ